MVSRRRVGHFVEFNFRRIEAQTLLNAFPPDSGVDYINPDDVRFKSNISVIVAADSPELEEMKDLIRAASLYEVPCL